MNKRYRAIWIACCLMLLFLAGPLLQPVAAEDNGQDLKVLLMYNPGYEKEAPHILAAYESVLQEEGVPYECRDVFALATENQIELVKTVPVVILPDYLLQHVPIWFGEWIKGYLAQGGNVAVIHDVGIRDERGYFLNQSPLAEVIGINYITYSKTGAAAFGVGHVQFPSREKREFLQIPPGKTVDDQILSSYGYGPLNYPMAQNEQIRDIPISSVYAYSVTPNNEKFPAVVIGDYGIGKTLYVNLPLGHLKANTDDLPLRSLLRTFLFDVVEIPHVMNVEAGRGGIVINWHVDSSVEHVTLPAMQKRGFLRPGIRSSFHITAGDFRDTPGDGLGYDAMGKGKKLTKLLTNYGVVGSHGGWAHNWFSYNVADGVFTEQAIRDNIAKNNASLESVIGDKIREYSAPNGAHPQPVATKILEEMGIVAYYYTGDTGSGPNRAFFEGRMVSDKVIAFPVMPFGRRASLYEMHAFEKKTNGDIAQSFSDVLEYAARHRTVRMLYSHPYDIEHYPQAMKVFFDKTETMQANGEIIVRPMSEFADFFLRFLHTTHAFRVEENQLHISLTNPNTLAGITVALPKKRYEKPLLNNAVIREDERYYYLTIDDRIGKEQAFTIHTH